ncbi:MAG: GNAT family N-acetyltransferase [Candidatus Eremiobacteraeota bacterium]|nr:GNAT family N-acetyltransferase [Candidatus Eremiobacteraeota bacterium]MBV9056027.1 GNAT family N-acetyltransferase [Candidatus Eremiobacteraeota bacterium]
MRIETARLVIRTFEPRDAQAWAAMLSDPDVRRYVPPSPVPAVADFSRALERRLRMERESGCALWAVEPKALGTLVGQCGLVPVEGKGPEIEIAYHFAKESWGNGYATEAAKAVLQYGLQTIGLERIIAIVMPQNVASCRVAEKAGMRFEGAATYYGIAELRKYVADGNTGEQVAR